MDARLWKLEESAGEAKVYVKSEARKATLDRMVEKKRLGFEAQLMRLNANLTKQGCMERCFAR